MISRIFWVPIACLIAVEIYARTFEGWGAWATAPLFLLPLVVSLAIAGGGVCQFFAELRSGHIRLPTVVCTLAAACPVLWLMVRRYVV